MAEDNNSFILDNESSPMNLDKYERKFNKSQMKD